MNTFRWKEFLKRTGTLIEYKNSILTEADASYVQKTYLVDIRCKIDKRSGGNKEETLDEIRGIPEVTVVSMVPGTSTSDAYSYLSTLTIKFELINNMDPVKYRDDILVPKLIAIKGYSLKHVGKIIEFARGAV
jgi:hypothetical protein